MTKIVIESDVPWIQTQLESVIHVEVDLLRKAIDKVVEKIKFFEAKYGQLRDELYGTVDDMELVEWEGEIESKKRLMARLKALEEIQFEAK